MNNDTTITVYCGNVIYENGKLKMLLNEAGYYSFQDNKFHFYLKDHQGNVRVVTDEAGNVDEVNDYYPFGGLMSNGCNNVQPYKYNGKELDRKGGLDWYDYGARYYDAMIGRWHVPDISSEKYYNWNSYTFCKSSPILRVDVDGKDDYVINESGKLFNTTPVKMRCKSPTDNLFLSTDRSIMVTVNSGLLGEMYKVQGEFACGLVYVGTRSKAVP